MRMHVGDWFRQGTNDEVAADREGGEDSTIYHLHTSTPHLHDISISGPFHSLDAIAHQMLQNFGPQCRQGGDTVLECVETGTLGSMQHITSPMNNDQNRTKTCRIIKEINPEVKAQLPGTAYVVIETDPCMELIRRMDPQAAVGLVPVRAMDVHGSFTEKAPATARARQIAQEIVARGSNRRIQDSTGRGAEVDSFVVVEGRDVIAILEARRDDGRSTDGGIPYPSSSHAV